MYEGIEHGIIVYKLLYIASKGDVYEDYIYEEIYVGMYSVCLF